MEDVKRLRSMAVTGIGELLWDVFPRGRSIGGGPANFAFHISQFGLDGWMASAVGDDQAGRELTGKLAGYPLNTIVETVDYPTGRIDIRLDREGVPQYEIAVGTAWDNIPYSPALSQLAAQTGTVCFGTLAQRSGVSCDTIRRFIAAIPAGSLKIFDINLRLNFYTREIIETSLGPADILKINEEEVAAIASLMSLDGTEDNICRRLMEKYGLKMLILTKGTDGSYILSSDGSESYMSTPKVKVADTVGAGDSFTAAFAAAIISGKSIPEAHALAVEVAAFVCTRKGGMPELPQSLIARIR
ncbi:MAG: carbohydrate kinase [Alistipes sp.]|nr:carbohydrate kinase [Alistipes sp.]